MFSFPSICTTNFLVMDLVYQALNHFAVMGPNGEKREQRTRVCPCYRPMVTGSLFQSTMEMIPTVATIGDQREKVSLTTSSDLKSSPLDVGNWRMEDCKTHSQQLTLRNFGFWLTRDQIFGHSDWTEWSTQLFELTQDQKLVHPLWAFGHS